jgi:undecaprenyl-diphosphatase
MALADQSGWHRHLMRFAPRDRTELTLLLGALGALVLVVAFFYLAGQVLEGSTQQFDELILRSLRRPDNLAVPRGPRWLELAAFDITALGGPTVLGLVVAATTGFLLLQGLTRTGLFVFVASVGGWVINGFLKDFFQRPRPEVVPHLRDVMSQSFPSGHALTSAVVYLTLGALMMRIAERRVTKFYCIGVAMLATVLVGLSRLYLGVHYPTDVLAGWIIGLCWALLCWTLERALERRTGLKREQQQALK